MRRGELLLLGGAAVALAAGAETAWSLHARFALDLEGLSELERAGAALWDFRPLAAAVFALGAVAALLGAAEPQPRLEPLVAPVRVGVAVLAAAQVALACIVVVSALWIAAAGEVGRPDELGFAYSAQDRALTLVTQLVAWVPLGALLALLAVRATTAAPDEVVAEEEAEPDAPVSEEMEDLWREHLAHGPNRERARTLLRRIHALEEAGDHDGARELADQMRRLR